MTVFVLSPLPGFDPDRLTWGAPDKPASRVCSYCDKPIPEGSVPLILNREDGWAVRFCDDCQRSVWGFETFDGFPSYYDTDDDPDAPGQP